VPFDWSPADCRLLLFKCQTSGFFGLVMEIILLERIQRSVDMAGHILFAAVTTADDEIHFAIFRRTLLDST
jgi:hypothetical protein